MVGIKIKHMMSDLVLLVSNSYQKGKHNRALALGHQQEVEAFFFLL